VVAPSADDQTAVQSALIMAKEGDVVCLKPGTYKFTTELDIAQKMLTLRGVGPDKTTLDFSGQTVGGNGMQITSDGVTVESFTVKNTPGDGIRATSVKGITYRDVHVVWDAKASLKNGAYGLYPVNSESVVIDKCVVTGARDAGIYVGQSTRVLITNSEAYGNVAGMELENTSEAEAYGNKAHDNAGGFLVFNLPNLPVQGGKRALVHDNDVSNNNGDNFGEPGTTVAKVPKGVGMIILSSDENEIAHNTIHGNDSAGLVVLSYGPPLFDTPKDPNFDRFPEGNFIHDNDFAGNGTNPYPTLGAAVLARPVPDVLWDGCTDAMKDNSTGALTNCLKNNGKGTYDNFNLCTMKGESTDLGPVTCEHPAVVPLKP
jgi:parallel beta-helix repeat protein